MADPNTLQIALISSSSAIAGAVISQAISLLQGSLDKKHQRRILLRERYEQLADHISESQSWPDTLIKCSSLSELSHAPLPIHARKALTISSIYFPALQMTCQNYVNSCANLKIFLINTYRPGPSGGEVGSIVAYLDADGFEKAINQNVRARQAVDDLVIKLASKYAKA